MKKFNILIGVEGLILLFNKINPSIEFTQISVILLILFFYFIFTTKLNIFMMNILIIFLLSLQIIGVYIIEIKSFYLNELDKFSFFKGSFPEIVFITMFFLYFLIKNEKKLKIKNYQCIKNETSKLGLILIMVYILYFFIKIVKNPYYSSNVDRFMYKYMYFNNIERILLNLNNGIMVYLGVKVTKKNKLKILYLILIILEIIFLFMMGCKFGDFIFPLGLIVTVTVLNNRKKIKKMKQSCYLFGGIVILVLTITFLHHIFLTKSFSKKSLENFKTYFIQRGAQEGQLWWGTFDKKYEGSIAEFINEFFPENSSEVYTSNENIKDEKGILKIMLLNTSSEIVQRKFETKSRYTGSTQASLNYYFGILGNLIYYYFISKLVLWFYKMLVHKIKNDVLYILYIILIVKLYMKIQELISMSAFSIIFYWKTIIVILGIFIIQYINKLIK